MTNTEASRPSRYSSMRILAPAAPNFPSKASERAVGTPAWCISSLAKIFEPSMRAAALEGPKIFRSSPQKHSAMPPIRGDSGPTTVRSISFSLAKSRRATRSSTGMSATCAMRDMPGLPGAANISGARGLAARASTRACSRPPLPTTITRTALGPDPLHYRLVALGADADHAQRSPDLGLHEPHEVPCCLGQVHPHPAPRDVLAPSGQRLVDGVGVVKVRLVHRVAVEGLPVHLVAGADLDLVDRREHVEHRQGTVRDPVQRSGPLYGRKVQPPDPPGPPRRRPVLAAYLPDPLPHLVEELGRHRPVPDPRRVGLRHPDDVLELPGRDAGTRDGPADGRVGGRYE